MFEKLILMPLVVEMKFYRQIGKMKSYLARLSMFTVYGYLFSYTLSVCTI